jgi:hypothetical protein
MALFLTWKRSTAWVNKLRLNLAKIYTCSTVCFNCHFFLYLLHSILMLNKLMQRSILCNVQTTTRIHRQSWLRYTRYYNTTGLRESTQLPTKLDVQLKRKELTFGNHCFQQVTNSRKDDQILTRNVRYWKHVCTHID